MLGSTEPANSKVNGIMKLSPKMGDCVGGVMNSTSEKEMGELSSSWVCYTHLCINNHMKSMNLSLPYPQIVGC